MGTILNLDSDVNLSDVIASNKRVLLDFYANWCEPCKQLFDTLEELTDKCEDLVIYKINIELRNDICKRYRIMSVPNLILINNGEVQRQISGVQTLNDLIKLINN